MLQLYSTFRKNILIILKESHIIELRKVIFLVEVTKPVKIVLIEVTKPIKIVLIEVTKPIKIVLIEGAGICLFPL